MAKLGCIFGYTTTYQLDYLQYRTEYITDSIFKH